MAPKAENTHRYGLEPYPPKTRWVGLPIQRFFSLASSFPDSHRERLQASSVRASGGADERGEQLATNQRGCGRRGLRAQMQAAALENFWGCSLQTTSLTREQGRLHGSTCFYPPAQIQNRVFFTTYKIGWILRYEKERQTEWVRFCFSFQGMFGTEGFCFSLQACSEGRKKNRGK